jgi:hypothetical protein
MNEYPKDTIGSYIENGLLARMILCSFDWYHHLLITAAGIENKDGTFKQASNFLEYHGQWIAAVRKYAISRQ